MEVRPLHSQGPAPLHPCLPARCLPSPPHAASLQPFNCRAFSGTRPSPSTPSTPQRRLELGRSSSTCFQKKSPLPSWSQKKQHRE